MSKIFKKNLKNMFTDGNKGAMISPEVERQIAFKFEKVNIL